MHRHAATDAHADGGDLGVADPNAGGPVFRRSVDVEFGQRRDDNPFQCADVGERAESCRPQVEYWIADKLPRSVVRHLPPSVRVVHLGVEFSEGVCRHEYVGLVAATAQGIDVRVLEQQKQRRKIASRHPMVKVALKCQRARVVDGTEMHDEAVGHGR